MFEKVYHSPRDFREISVWKHITQAQWQDPKWQLKNVVKDVETLSGVIKLSEYQKSEIQRTIDTLKAEGKEPFRITPYYTSLMQYDPFHPVYPGMDFPQNRLDPIFWQSVPTPANLLFSDTGAEGAMCESSRSYGAVYQRYPNRVALFVAENTSCASYCVHCQRSKSLDCSVEVDKSKIDRGLFYISYNKNINEVLVTGGDALTISPKRLRYILEELSRIDHLRTIRIATRVPVVIPMLITDELLQMIQLSANKHKNGPEKYVYFMTHINHFQEITQEMARAVKKIRDHGFAIRNQTVLLKHVNDDFQILAETFRRMFWIGVHPYYLLQCHKEKGIIHFITPVQLGKIFVKHLQGWISGITMPRYAANIEGGGGKVLLMPSGHDTLNSNLSLEDSIAESYATVSTWDSRKIYKYESLGRSTKEEYSEAVKIMDRFIGRKDVFIPSLIIIDEQGNHIETTNRKRLPSFNTAKKNMMLKYLNTYKGNPITNPALLSDELEKLFLASDYNNDFRQ